MSEASMWRRLRPEFRSIDEHAVRVENVAEVGTPDVNLSFDGYDGWIELKHVDHWPVRVKTNLAVNNFTRQQRLWLERRFRINSSAHLLLQVGRDWLLFDGDIAAKYLGKSPRSVLEKMATAVWIDEFKPGELKSALTMRFPHGRPKNSQLHLVEARRTKILRMFTRYEDLHAHAPSIKYLSRRTGLNINIVNRTLEQLTKRGDLRSFEIKADLPGRKRKGFTSNTG